MKRVQVFFVFFAALSVSAIAQQADSTSVESQSGFVVNPKSEANVTSGFVTKPDSLSTQTDEQRPDWEAYLNDVLSPEDYDEAQWEALCEFFGELEQHPMNINTATREDLERLPFLLEQVVEDIQEYIYRYGPMKSLNELMMIRSLDYRERQLLRCFIVVEEPPSDKRLFPTLDDLAKYARHTLMATAKVPLCKPDDADKWRGYPVKHWVRYEANYHNRLRIGIIGSQDAGEPFFANKNKTGYDFYSYYVQLQNIGRLENLVVGKYKVSMGLGLIMNSHFTLGKQMMLQNLGRVTNNAVTPHSSRTYYNYLEGAAATIRLGDDWRITGFASYRHMDATLNKDGSAATILETGYHRTDNELAKKNNLSNTTFGGQLAWRHHALRASLNIVGTHFNRPLRPNTNQQYRRFYPQGYDFLNTSVAYSYHHPRFTISGETAVDADFHLAMLNTLTFRIKDEWTLTALYRFYSYKYTSIFANSFSDASRVQNENGIYVGATYRLSLKWQLSAYVDYAHHPWHRYQIPGPSDVFDALIQATHDTRCQWRFDARYRFRYKQSAEHRTRLYATYTGRFVSKTQLDATLIDRSRGVMVSESVGYTWRWLKADAGVGYFYTDDFSARIYGYETGPLYTYGFMQYFGHGWRLWTMAKASLGERLTLTAKVGTAKHKTDLDVQLRLKF